MLMTLDDWVEAEIQRVEKFRQWWMINHVNAKEKDIWPMEMPAGEWDEQYRCYGE
jgi:hypothetical protein